jgi:hypothetical protein
VSLLPLCLGALACLSYANADSSNSLVPQPNSLATAPIDARTQLIGGESNFGAATERDAAVAVWSADVQHEDTDPSPSASHSRPQPFDDSSAKQQPARSITPDEVERVISGLRAVTDDLNKAVRSYHAHLDDAIAKYDRGPRSPDADLISGGASDAQASIRKAVAARSLAVAQGEPRYRPGFLADLKEIQNLILTARQRLDGSDPVNLWLLVVSPAELNSGEAASKKLRHAQLIKAREASRVAANKALAELPIPLPEDNSMKEDSSADVLPGRGRASQHGRPDDNSTRQETPRELASPVLPLHWEPGRRVLLINDLGFRLALTDQGTRDLKGRPLFYQEQWVQRGRVVRQAAQLVSVDISTGQHILVKRYPPEEFTGSVEDAYRLPGLNESRSVRAPDREPSRPQVESALAQVEHAPETLLTARQRYTSTLQAALSRSDQRHLNKGEDVLDAGLPEETRMRLYAIRGRLLRASAVLEAENTLQEEMRKTEKRIEDLKGLAAWANRATPEDSSAVLPAAVWDRLQTKADDAIYVSRKSNASALAALPPNSTDTQAKFAALFRDGIVHMVSVRTSTESDRALWQEVWTWEPSGPRRIRQGIEMIVVDPATGDQIRLSRQTRYYVADRNESLVDAYERLGGPVAPPLKTYVPPDVFRDPMLSASISTAQPVSTDPETLVARIASAGVHCETCRTALHQLASHLSAHLAPRDDEILRNIAADTKLISNLRSELNRSNPDAAWVLASLPYAVNVPRSEILEDLFWKIPPPLSSSEGVSEPLFGAWTRMADRSPPQDYIQFLQRAFKSRDHRLDPQHAAQALKRLHWRRYRELIEHDGAVLQDLIDYFQDVVTMADPNTVNPIITVMATVNTAPAIQKALQKGLRDLPSVPIEPFNNPSFEWIKEARTLLRWAIAYVPAQLVYDDASTLKNLLVRSLDVDPEVDPDSSEALNARIDAKAQEEGSQSLTQLFKDVMAGVDSSRLLPGELRLVPPLLSAMDRRLAESLQGVQMDADFREEFLNYVELVIDRASPGPEEALRLLDDLARSELAGDFFSEFAPILQEGLARIRNSGHLTQPGKSGRIGAIQTIWNRSFKHPS